MGGQGGSERPEARAAAFEAGRGIVVAGAEGQRLPGTELGSAVQILTLSFTTRRIRKLQQLLLWRSGRLHAVSRWLRVAHTVAGREEIST